MALHLLVRGDHACFRRPEFATDLISYDVMTPIAARRVFEIVHGPPSIRWSIENIRVLNPIRMQWREIVDHERSDRIHRVHALIDVAYIVTARFELTHRARAGETAAAHVAMFRRRAQRGSFHRQPFLGLTDFIADIAYMDQHELPFASNEGASVDLGWMIYDSPGAMRSGARFFRARLIDGVMTIPDPDSQDLAS